MRRVTKDDEEVYNKPYKIVDRLPKEAMVRVMGVSQEGGFVPVEYYKDEKTIDTALMIGSFLEKPLQATEPRVQASFSCVGVFGGIKKVICSDHYLGLLDKQLNDVYKQAKLNSGTSASSVQDLKKSQRAWIKERNKIQNLKTPDKQKASLQQLYEERIKFLKEWGE